MPLTLSQLTEFDDIVIQCHDNPDADALASGYALHWYLRRMGKSARFIYGGKNPVSKSNLLLMIEELGIPVEYVVRIDAPQLLVTVDCQYGESNVTHFDAEHIAVIDHHQVSGPLPDLSEVRSSYGSCATVMYELLQKEGIDINSDENIATALYYGLMTDTGGFTEISHPADKDLRDLAGFNNADITRFRNANISRDELSIAGDALKTAEYHDENSYAIVEAKPCDPNILGIISDMLLEVDTVDTCLVYSILPFGVKISVRSCIKEVRASEMAAFIAHGYGGGGGHIVKAGGLLKKEILEHDGISYDAGRIRDFLRGRMQQYFEDTQIIYAGKHLEDIGQMKHYIKRELKCGYVKADMLASPGTEITIRTLEGDVDVVIRPDLYIMIGVEGEIYPCTRDRFESNNYISDEEYEYPGEYAPSVVNITTGERIGLLPHAKSCVSNGGTGIYARRLGHRVKVFSFWDEDKYYLGNPGDYLAVSADDPHDIFIIPGDLFKKTYGS